MSRRKTSVPHRKQFIEELKEDPQLAIEYLNAAAEEDDPQTALLALRTVAEALGMAKVAKAAGLPRESLYRALSPNGNPRLSTLHAVLRAAGLRLAFERVE